MSNKLFEEKELKVVKEFKSFFGTGIPVFDYPVGIGEASVACWRDKKPWWLPTDVETQTFCPSVIADNTARGFVFEGGEPYPREKFGGPDIFGIEWVYVDVAGGSMVKPGSPAMEDANDWEKIIKFPDINTWDWAGSAEKNKAFLESGRANVMMLLNGCWFERLISFMDFQGAAMALIDEEQIDAVKELTHKMTDLYLDIIDKVVEYYNLHGVCIHDDWGSQGAPFFSAAVARDVYLPEMKRFVEHVHSKGLFCDLHSCGHAEDRCDIFVEAGFDSWSPMPMNNTIALYEKYGDRICIGIVNDKPFDPATATEEEQRECAREFVRRFCKKGTTCAFSGFYNPPGQLTPAFREELYKASRIAYSK